MSFLAKNPISGLSVVISRDDEMLVAKPEGKKLDSASFRVIKKNKTKIIKERSEHLIRAWKPSN